MNKSTYRKTIDVQKHGSQFTVNAVQGEAAARRLVLTVLDGGKPFDFGDGTYSVAVFGEKPDGTVFSNACTRSGNVVTYDITSNNVAVVGDVRARLRVIEGTGDAEQILYSPEFTIAVDDCYDISDAESSSDEFGALADALIAVETLDIDVDKPEGSTTATVTVTHQDGTTDSVEINDGQQGATGATGADGYSPTATVVRGTNKATITITDKNGTTSADVYDGQGGGTSFTPDSTLYLENDTLGIDFAEDTQSGLETGKAVRSNEFNTAMNIISTTFGGFVSQLAGKEDAFTVGKGLSLANGVMSAVPRRMLFVDDKPTSNIDQNAIYLIPDSFFFPSVSSLVGTIEGEPQMAAVTYDDGIGYRFIRFNKTGNKAYDTSGCLSMEWELFTTDGVSWTKVGQSASGGDKAWASTMGWTTSSTGGMYTNVMWANSTFYYIAAYKHWDTANNKAKIDGTAETGQTVPAYQLMMWQYNGSSWEALGVCDYTKLFGKVYSKDEVDTLISTAIADVSELIGGAS